MTLSLAEANSIVAAAIMKARQLNVKVSVVVCDKLGNVIALNRMDGAYATVNRYSIGKAVVSAGAGLPSGDVVGIVDHSPVCVAVAQGVPAIRIRGGLPVLRGGEVEGGCGVAGARSPEQDEECAALGLRSWSANTPVDKPRIVISQPAAARFSIPREGRALLTCAGIGRTPSTSSSRWHTDCRSCR
jgi:glc operon protein GlcG